MKLSVKNNRKGSLQPVFVFRTEYVGVFFFFLMFVLQ